MYVIQKITNGSTPHFRKSTSNVFLSISFYNSSEKVSKFILFSRFVFDNPSVHQIMPIGGIEGNPQENKLLAGKFDFLGLALVGILFLASRQLASLVPTPSTTHTICVVLVPRHIPDSPQRQPLLLNPGKPCRWPRRRRRKADDSQPYGVSIIPCLR